MSNGLFIGDKDPVEIRVGSRKALSVYYSGDNVPQNPVLHISAKDMDIGEIKNDGWILDLSGKNNHGQAYNGVTVINDSELGKCFSFDGVDDYFQVITTDFANAINGHTELSIVFTGKTYERPAATLRTMGLFYGNYGRGFLMFDSSNRIIFSDRLVGSDTQRDLYSGTNTGAQYVHQYAVSVNYSTGKCFLFVDGVKTTESETWFTGTKDNVRGFMVGRLGSNYAKIMVSEVKIFPYALTSEQVQALYRGIKKVWSNVPEGAILHLNAKGLTTAGIAQSGGVVDLSGNGNNGTAYGGVEVVNDSEMGECFSFNATNRTYIDVTSSNLLTMLDSAKAYTLSFNAKCSNRFYSTLGGLIRLGTTSCGAITTLCKESKPVLNFGDHLNSVGSKSFTYNYSTFERIEDKICQYVVVVDYENGILKFALNGEIKAVDTEWFKTETFENIKTLTKIRIGATNPSGSAQYCFNGLISDIQIYPYALTAHEVKKLYMASRR